MKDKFFLAGDFLDIQYVWIFPFLQKYLQYKKIDTIVTEKNLPKRVINNKILKKYTKYNFKNLKHNSIILKFIAFIYIFKYFSILIKFYF